MYLRGYVNVKASRNVEMREREEGMMMKVMIRGET